MTVAYDMRCASILYWGQAIQLLQPMHKALCSEFGFSNIVDRDVEPLLETSILQDHHQLHVPDALFVLAERTVTSHEDLVLFLAPLRLVTPFGYKIAGETRGKCIVVSSLVVTSQNISRLLRHEMGHFFGLSEHLGCVMSPYAIEDPTFCQTCVSTLHRLGVNWNALNPIVSDSC